MARLTPSELGKLSWSTPERRERHIISLRASWDDPERLAAARWWKCGHVETEENINAQGRCRKCTRARAYRQYHRKHPRTCKLIFDPVGLRFGRLIVTEETNKKHRKDWLYLAHCDCGNEILMRKYQLRQSSSCGCLKVELARVKAKTQSRINGKFA